MSVTMTFKNVKQLDTAIDQIIVGAKNQRDMIQQISIGIVSHAAGKGSGNVSLDRDMLTTENFNDAKGVMWCDVKKATPYKGFDFKAALVKQLKQAYQASEAAKDDAKKDKVQMTAFELKALEQFVQSQVGADSMPKKPDALKKNTGNITAVAKKAA